MPASPSPNVSVDALEPTGAGAGGPRAIAPLLLLEDTARGQLLAGEQASSDGGAVASWAWTSSLGPSRPEGENERVCLRPPSTVSSLRKSRWTATGERREPPFQVPSTAHAPVQHGTSSSRCVRRRSLACPHCQGPPSTRSHAATISRGSVASSRSDLCREDTILIDMGHRCSGPPARKSASASAASCWPRGPRDSPVLRSGRGQLERLGPNRPELEVPVQK